MQRIPVAAFFEHGANVEPEGATGRAWAAFREMCAQTRPKLIVPEPGFRLPVEGLDATVVSTDGKLIDKPLPGGGEANVTGLPT